MRSTNDRAFNVSMRFYIRELERCDLQDMARDNYLQIAEEILKRNMQAKGYSRYRFLLDRYKPRSNL